MDYKSISELNGKGITLFNNAAKVFDGDDPKSFYHQLAKQLIVLNEKFETHQLEILVAGEVSTGKSTFINTLVGSNVLPTAKETCTNVPSKIMYGKDAKLVVHFNSDEKGGVQPSKEITKEEYPEYSTESLNPKNARNVQYIEVHADSPLLQKGIVFIDTPGLGAIDPLHAVTTYSVAAKADIILFLGDVCKPLTLSEVLSLKDLLKVSKSTNVLHLVARSDLGDKEVIMNENEKIIRRELPDLDFKSFAISAAKYSKYVRSGNKWDLEDSGFLNVIGFIDGINTSLDDILNRRFAILSYFVYKSGYTKFSSLYQSAKDPATLHTRKVELGNFEKRAKNIIENQRKWELELAGQIKKLIINTNAFMEEQKRYIQKNVEKNVDREDDYYISNTNALSKTITADITSFKGSLQKKISDDFAKIYDWLREYTELKDIQEKVSHSEIEIESSVEISESKWKYKVDDKILDYTRAGLFAMTAGIVLHGLGSATGMLIGTKIGALIGVAGGPVGAAIGGLTGAIAGILAGLKSLFQSKKTRKEKKRNAIKTECRKKIDEFFAEIKASVTNIQNDGEVTLRQEFIDEVKRTLENIKKERDELSTRISKLDLSTQYGAQNFKTLEGMKDSCNAICEQLKNNNSF